MCAVAAGLVGSLRIHGHGIVVRQQRGPPTPDGAPTCRAIVLRCYRCLDCGAVMRVGPASCAPRKHFSLVAIVQALALWGALAVSASVVRDRINDWRIRGASARGWPALRRWTRDLANGRLLRSISLEVRSTRRAASELAQRLAGHSPPEARSLPLDHQAACGACHVS